MPQYRWNVGAEAWEFNEPAFGGWVPLRISPHVSSRPMTFVEGIRHFITHDLVRGREPETEWVNGAALRLNIAYKSAGQITAWTWLRRLAASLSRPTEEGRV